LVALKWSEVPKRPSRYSPDRYRPDRYRPDGYRQDRYRPDGYRPDRGYEAGSEYGPRGEYGPSGEYGPVGAGPVRLDMDAWRADVQRHPSSTRGPVAGTHGPASEYPNGHTPLLGQSAHPSARSAARREPRRSSRPARRSRKKFLWRRTVVVLAIASLGAVVWDVGSRVVAIAGADPSPAAQHVYVVRPGDTIWSIAVRSTRGGDPWRTVNSLETQIGGGVLQPGERLVLP
jgi:hypothetical protein